MKTILFAALLFTSACASDDGTAPAITALTYAPMTATHGVATTVTGTFTFDDDDGDLAELGGEVTLPDQSKMSFQKTDIRNVGDTKQGTLSFQLSFIPPAAGTYQFALFVTDEGGNVSNRLDGTLTVN